MFECGLSGSSHHGTLLNLFAAVIWLKCRYVVKLYPINQSINLFEYSRYMLCNSDPLMTKAKRLIGCSQCSALMNTSVVPQGKHIKYNSLKMTISHAVYKRTAQ